jgi:predicted site-specific integrase-resolvase
MNMSDTRETALAGHDDLLSPEQAATILRKSTATLSRWRTAGLGPPYIKNGGSIEYRRSDLEDYRLRHRRLVPATTFAVA